MHALPIPSHRRLPRWKSSSARLVSKILAHYETCADPQMLASVASVVSSASRDGGCTDGLPQGEAQPNSCDRFMDCYAERCYHWGAEGERAKTICHQTKTEGHPLRSWRDTGRPMDEPDGLVCSVCDETVRGRPLLCYRCGHGGHSKHVTVRSLCKAKRNHVPYSDRKTGGLLLFRFSTDA